jgi:hypothetical protein
MNENELEEAIEKEKDDAFDKVRDILLTFGGTKIDGFERARHALDLLEELSARVISSCSTDEKSADALCDTFGKNLQMLAHQFLAQEKKPT